MDEIKKNIEAILLEYMDYSNEETAFEDGYIPDIYDPSKLRDDLLALFEKLVGEKDA